MLDARVDLGITAYQADMLLTKIPPLVDFYKELQKLSFNLGFMEHCQNNLSIIIKYFQICVLSVISELSHVMRKPTVCICENKDADHLRGYRFREADQRLCFLYIDRTIRLLAKCKISSLYPSSVPVQPCLCRIRPTGYKIYFHAQLS